MNLFDLIERFPDKESCLSHLEQVRWGEHPECPHCKSDKVARKQERGNVGRWNCYACKSSFNVLAGTLFQGTKIPLPKWFLAIRLMVNAKKSLSSSLLARHLDLTQPSAWYMMRRIQKEMKRNGKTRLKSIIEVDETCIGGKPRRRKNDERELPPPSKHGKHTQKTQTEPNTQLALFEFNQNQ